MKELTIHIYRGDGKKGQEKTYKVPYQHGMVVLTAVQHIQNLIDTDLGARWNCRAGKCGSCGAEINGVPRLMCKTRVDEFEGDIHVRPYKAFPSIKDLVPDVSSNFERAKTIPPFVPLQEQVPFVVYQEDMERSIEFRKCIECFICQDVCHVLRDHDTDYIGPCYIVKSAYLDMHPMDKRTRNRFLKDQARIGYCNITRCCQDLCPEDIAITDNAIIPEKERVISEFYDPLLWILNKIRGKGKQEG
jgi:succinate dehydrogenase / fumarate reductase iron-sulfur subunit